MLKTNTLRKVGLIFLAGILMLLVGIFVACSNSKKPRGVYVVFESEYAEDESYSLSAPGYINVTVPSKAGGYWYKAVAYYADTKEPTGEQTSGIMYKWSTPGQHTIELPVYLEEYGYSSTYSFHLTIEKPPKKTPETRLDPNGAIDYIDGEYYKYEYNGKLQCPLLYAYDGETEIKLKEESFHIVSCRDEYGDVYTLPIDQGIYTVHLRPIYVATGQYYTDEYNAIQIYLTIEIV